MSGAWGWVDVTQELRLLWNYKEIGGGGVSGAWGGWM